MKFGEIYNLAFDNKDLLKEAPHIAIPLAYSLNRDENYFDAKLEKLSDYPLPMEIVEHFINRFKKRKLNKMQREKVYDNEILSGIMEKKYNMTFYSLLNPENKNSMSIKDRIEFELEYNPYDDYT